jgi:hypothetical protein
MIIKKILFLCFFAGLSSIGFSQFEGSKQTFSAPNLKDQITTHQKVAILPFEAAITYKRPPKNYDAEANRNEEINTGKNLQQSMYTYLLRKGENYSVSFQDVDRTNAILKSKGMYDNLDTYTQDSICKALGVDAVVKCRYAYEKTDSEAGAIVKTVFIGNMGFKTGSGALTLQIYNGKDGELLWRFYKAMDDKVMSSTDVIERMMRKVSRNFPYEK